MLPIGKLNQNLQFNKDIGGLIEIMKLAATLQFNQFRSREFIQPGFSAVLDSTFGYIAGMMPEENIFFRPTADLPTLVVLVSSDEGFLGELNLLLVNKAANILKEGDEVVVLGQQGAEYLTESGILFSSCLPLPGDKMNWASVASLRDYILKSYLKKSAGKVYIVFANFVNISFQQVEMETLFPLVLPEAGARLKDKLKEEFIVEPGIDAVIEGWARAWLGHRLYQIFWSAKLAEYAARIMHLEGSVQELTRINQRLRIEYFKYLHALSDKSIRELSASRILWKK